jgi:hypothetical protein
MSAKELCIFIQEPHSSTKEPCISVKEPCMSAKELYIHPFESYTVPQRPCGQVPFATKETATKNDEETFETDL